MCNNKYFFNWVVTYGVILYSKEWRHTAAHQKPEKKNSSASKNNSSSVATRAYSFRRLRKQQAALLSHISQASHKQSPISSNHTESELPVVEQETCAIDLWEWRIESAQVNSYRSSTEPSARSVPVTTQDRPRRGSPQGLKNTGQL